MKHIPLPYEIDEDGYLLYEGITFGRIYDSSEYPCVDEDDLPAIEAELQETRKFITRACNSHYELIETCEMLLKIFDDGSWNDTVQKILNRGYAAIQKAKAE